MVCKEEVFTWFQNLKGSKRIEAMCGFLNMCYPLELRFYGTCLEDLGRRDYYTIRDEEVKANNITEVLKIRNIHNPYMRSKLIVVLSLLNSSNIPCAGEIFRVLSDELKIDTLVSLGILSDPKQVEQYLLLLTLAQHHPAFTFSQQTYLSDLSIILEKCASDMISNTSYQTEESCLQSPVFPHVGSRSQVTMSEADMYNNSPHSYYLPHMQRRTADVIQNPVRITNLKIKAPHRKRSIRIRVSWSNDKITDTFKTPKDILGFHQKLLEYFPSESKAVTQERLIQALTQSVLNAAQMDCVNENIISVVTEYIMQLNTGLPNYVFENEFVTSFFMPSHNRSTFIKGNKNFNVQHGDNPPRDLRLHTLTFVNSKIADNPSSHQAVDYRANAPPVQRSENGSSCGRESPYISPIQSPLSSPYASPMSSGTNSRSASPWSHNVGLYRERGATNSYSDSLPVDKTLADQNSEQWDAARNYKIEELQAMPIEELESLGILADSKGKKVPGRKSPPNGLLNSFLPKSSTIPAKPSNLLLQRPPSNESSPVCSEYSSPPQSPSPPDTCNQSSSLSSSTEENGDKRNTITAASEITKTDEFESPQNLTEPNFKRTEDDALSLKSNMNRTTISVFPFPPPYNSIISQMPPPHNMKPAYLPVPCRASNAPQHMSPGTLVFDNQFSRLPLPSALTFLPGPPPRSHNITPDRVLGPHNIPISSVSPFPVVTSGCATVPSASCCITTPKSSNMTVVSNSSASSSSRHSQKNPSLRDSELAVKPGDTPYGVSAFMQHSNSQSIPASCTCYTTSSARPSPAPSPSMSPGTTQQLSAVPVSLPYIGMPYLFHHSLPFLQSQGPVNGFVPQPGMGNPGQTFSYALPNGLTAIPPELIYPAHFTLQSPSNQSNPGQVTSPVSQCYGAFTHTTAVPVKFISCYNCGKLGHRGSECKEQTMEDLNKGGKFQLNYTPIPKIPDSHE